MTTSTLPAATAEARPPAEERGSLSLSERVVEKIATAAVREVGGTGGGPRRVLGLTIGNAGSDEDRDARVDARLYGNTATVRVQMTARYPGSIRGVAADVRRSVIERLDELAAVDVSFVDVEVVGLGRPESRRRTVR